VSAGQKAEKNYQRKFKLLISSLKNQKEFDLVNRSGKKFYTPYFIAVIAKNSNEALRDSEHEFLFGIKVGRKLGKAVIRNMIKRRIRHLVRLLSAEQKIYQTRWQMVIIPKKNFEKIEFALLLSELTRIIA
jgi:ribonuclease P protein component